MSVNGVPDTAALPGDCSKLPHELQLEVNAIREAGILGPNDLDSRAIDAICGLLLGDALAVLAELKHTNLEHVSNKSAYLCGLIKTYRQKNRLASLHKNTDGDNKPNVVKPDEAKIKEILERTGYSLDVSTGQRRYGGPPPNWTEPQPGPGHEIYCGKLPKDLFEDSLIPLFENIGKIWDLRLMMDPISGRNRGYCFVTFTEKKSAEEAVRKLNNYEIRPGKYLKVNASVANTRLFVGNIPKNRSKDEILEEFQKHTEGLVSVIVYSAPDDPKKLNRGFAFLDYDSHKSASAARRTIASTRLHIWGSEIIVEWAEPQEEPDEETMSKVKVLYVRNLRSDVNDTQLKETFEKYGTVERVKRVKSYGFVHFADRESALNAMNELNGTSIGESVIEITLAKPSNRNKQQREKWRFQHGNYSMGYDGGYPMHYGGYIPRGGRGMRRQFHEYGYNNYYNAYGYPNFEYGAYDPSGYYYSPGARYGNMPAYGQQRGRNGGQVWAGRQNYSRPWNNGSHRGTGRVAHAY
jgi:RNA recognition motif-containing protein